MSLHNLPRPVPVGERFYRTEWMGTPPDIAASPSGCTAS